MKRLLYKIQAWTAETSGRGQTNLWGVEKETDLKEDYDE